MGDSRAHAPVHQIWEVIPSVSHHSSAQALIAECLLRSRELVVHLTYHASLDAAIVQPWAATLPPPLRARLDMVPCGSPDLKVTATNWMIIMADLLPALYAARTRLLAEASISKVMLSMFAGEGEVQWYRERAPGTEVWMHWSASAGCLWWVTAPSPRGAGDYKKTVAAQTSGTQLAQPEMAALLNRIMHAANGTLELTGAVVEIPGVAPMYDYELHAMNHPMPPALAMFWARSVDVAKLADGVVIATSTELEGAVCKDLENWIKRVVPLGLSTTPRGWAGAAPAEGEVSAFLDKHEEEGVLYIAFGSNYFPHTWANEFFSLLLASNRPFLLNTPPIPTSKLSDEIVSQIRASPKAHLNEGLLDQLGVLSHPATTWYLHHGGWNSTEETLITGVPSVIWPIAHGDQPYNAALLSTLPPPAGPLGVELTQIRGEGAQRAMKRGGQVSGKEKDVMAEFEQVLGITQRNNGEGEAVRRNCEAFAEKIKVEREGRAAKAIQDFCKS